MKLEKMDAFFSARLSGYDGHMMAEIEGAREFYPYTATLLPLGRDARVLNLGCGTGLELEYYFAINGEAPVAGIDLSADMPAELKCKFADRKIEPVSNSPPVRRITAEMRPASGKSLCLRGFEELA